MLGSQNSASNMRIPIYVLFSFTKESSYFIFPYRALFIVRDENVKYSRHSRHENMCRTVNRHFHFMETYRNFHSTVRILLQREYEKSQKNKKYCGKKNILWKYVNFLRRNFEWYIFKTAIALSTESHVLFETHIKTLRHKILTMKESVYAGDVHISISKLHRKSMHMIITRKQNTLRPEKCTMETWILRIVLFKSHVFFVTHIK